MDSTIPALKQRMQAASHASRQDLNGDDNGTAPADGAAGESKLLMVLAVLLRLQRLRASLTAVFAAGANGRGRNAH